MRQDSPSRSRRILRLVYSCEEAVEVFVEAHYDSSCVGPGQGYAGVICETQERRLGPAEAFPSCLDSSLIDFDEPRSCSNLVFFASHNHQPSTHNPLVPPSSRYAYSQSLL